VYALISGVFKQRFQITVDEKRKRLIIEDWKGEEKRWLTPFSIYKIEKRL
jgi:hypothetical protein